MHLSQLILNIIISDGENDDLTMMLCFFVFGFVFCEFSVIDCRKFDLNIPLLNASGEGVLITSCNSGELRNSLAFLSRISSITS
jgi:hypothetical protein